MKNIFAILLSLGSLNIAFASEQNSKLEYTLLQENELKITAKFSGYDEGIETYEFTYTDEYGEEMTTSFDTISQELIDKYKLNSSLNVGKVFEIIFEEKIVSEGDGDYETTTLEIVSLILK